MFIDDHYAEWRNRKKDTDDTLLTNINMCKTNLFHYKNILSSFTAHFLSHYMGISKMASSNHVLWPLACYSIISDFEHPHWFSQYASTLTNNVFYLPLSPSGNYFVPLLFEISFVYWHGLFELLLQWLLTHGLTINDIYNLCTYLIGLFLSLILI